MMSDEPILNRLDTPDPEPGPDGDWAPTPKPRTHTFTKEGHEPHTVELNDRISSITLLQLGAAVGMGTEGGTEFMTTVWEALTDSLAPGQLRPFSKWTKEVDASMPELMEWIGELIGELSGRPFEEESPSPTGQPETPTGSTGPGDATPETPPGPVSPV